MLMLSRKAGETIVLGEGVDEVTIVVSKIRGHQVAIGVKAPKSINVRRGELGPRPTRPKGRPLGEDAA